MSPADVLWGAAYVLGAIGVVGLVHEVLFGSSPAAFMPPFTTVDGQLDNWGRCAAYQFNLVAGRHHRRADYQRRAARGLYLQGHLRATGRFPTTA